MKRPLKSTQRNSFKMKTSDRIAMPPPARRRRNSPRAKSSRSSLSSVSSTNSRSSSTSSCPTSAMTLHSSNHGRSRRHQRGIRIRQLKAAMKHGHRSPGGRGRSKYSHRGITFVVDDATKREITSFATPLDLPYKEVSPQDMSRHVEAAAQIRDNPSQTKSHTVLLVDVSGSMRNSDVQGSRTRLGAVWLALAEDFVRQRIESGVAGDQDAITVVLMGETAKIHPRLSDVPTDLLVYNEFLQIYKEGSITAGGHGCYRPALNVARNILTKYDSSSCALALCILSDGRPSDAYLYKQSWDDASNDLTACIESLASRLGRRLTVQTVGIGSENRFQTLQAMSSAATNYGSVSAFQLPSMTSSSLGAALSSIATSLTESQTELTNPNDASRTQRRVRKVIRENRNQIPLLTEVVDSEEFDIYMYGAADRQIYNPDQGTFGKAPFLHPDAAGVAIKKKPFGEGTERFAYQFFEVAKDGITTVGKALVAKESKFIEEPEHSPEDSEKFVKRFCRIQNQATKAAQAFNKKLDTLATLDPDTARVSFLPCSVYHLQDAERGSYAVIVEEYLSYGKFQKWNSNNGWKKSQKSTRSTRESAPLAVIPEFVVSDANVGAADNADDSGEDTLFVTHDEVAQAFSHFSYIYGGRKMLICDLQGVYNRPGRALQFTDPVIHYHDVRKEDVRGKYGRTDRGDKGIEDFLHSHECNCLCDLVTKGFFPVQMPEYGYCENIKENLRTARQD